MHKYTLFITVVAISLLSYSIAAYILDQQAEAKSVKKIKDMTCEELDKAFIALAKYSEPNPPHFFNCGPTPFP